MEEIWKDIPESSHYQVSNKGNVKNTKTGKILKPRNSAGYYRVAISINGIFKQLSIHRLVAEAFLTNPNGYPIINHKDEDKYNNFVWVNPDGSIDQDKSNIEWCSYSYNLTYGTRHKEKIERKNSTCVREKKGRDKEKLNAAIKRYRERHPEKVKEAVKKWQAKNPEKIKEYKKKYYLKKKYFL